MRSINPRFTYLLTYADIRYGSRDMRRQLTSGGRKLPFLMPLVALSSKPLQIRPELS